MPASEGRALRAWAFSGAMALTGRAAGPPRAAPGDVAGQMQQSLSRFASMCAARTDATPLLPDVRLLGERAALTGLGRNGPRSCGGAFRTVRTSDGWFGVSLPRPADLTLVPALVEAVCDGEDVWEVVAGWAACTTTSAAVERARLLGLPAAAVPDEPDPPVLGRAPVVVGESDTARRFRRERPLVVDLTSMWAGPLCAHLLRLGGAQVVKVESPQRPDGARRGSPDFFDVLNAGHLMVALELGTPRGVDQLRRLIDRADLVIEGSRPRALRQMGIDAEEIVRSGTSWLSITARGRDSDTIGFGDDVAVDAGLVVLDEGELLPCGDALADPLTGVAAAEAAAAALVQERASLLDVSMFHVAAVAAAASGPGDHQVRRIDGRWIVEDASGRFPVRPPSSRRAEGRAHEVGADTEAQVR